MQSNWQRNIIVFKDAFDVSVAEASVVRAPARRIQISADF